MIKNILMVLFCVGITQAQKRIITDTIYGTENKNTTLFFPSPIKKAITGSENFFIGWNEESPSTIGVFKAAPGVESNMLIITENGNIFSFVVRYKQDIAKANYFITNEMAVGNEKNNSIKKSEKETKSEIIETADINNDTINVIQKTCKEEINKPPFYNRIYGSKNKILVQLKNIKYLNNELYFTLILKNNSSLDYEINYLNFYVNSQNKKRNTTSQSVVMKTQWISNMPKKIEAGDTVQVVYVFEKFTINEKKLIVVELSEINGERDVYLEIPNTFINNPN